MSSPALLSDSDVEQVESEPQDLVCTECKKSITNDPSLPIADFSSNLFVATKPASEVNAATPVVICGECAVNIVHLHLARSGRMFVSKSSA